MRIGAGVIAMRTHSGELFRQVSFLIVLVVCVCGRQLPCHAQPGNTPQLSPEAALEHKVRSSRWRDDTMKLNDEEWRSKLSPEQFRVLRDAGTERPFTSPLLNKSEKGVFKCAACGLELFTSEDKFDSGTGWPSFTKPTGTDTLFYKTDESLGEKRIEVLCARCGGHLGHVFPKGDSTEEFRYCINGDALTLDTASAK